MWLLTDARHDNVLFLPLYTFHINFTKAFLPSYLPVQTSSFEPTIVLLILHCRASSCSSQLEALCQQKNLIGHFTLLKL